MYGGRICEKSQLTKEGKVGIIRHGESVFLYNYKRKHCQQTKKGRLQVVRGAEQDSHGAKDRGTIRSKAFAVLKCAFGSFDPTKRAIA